MKIKPESPVWGFLKRNGFYIAVAAFVLAGAALSYATVATMIDVVEREPEPAIEQTAPPAAESAAEPAEPEPVETESVSEEDAEAVAATITEEPLMPVYVRALPGALTKPFSGDELVKSETLGDWRTHNGADYAASEGDTVAAVYSGTVARAGYDELLGNIIELELDSGYTVLYGNLAPISGLRAGERVSQGDAIGAVGRSCVIESAEAPHLHLELKSGDKALDPEILFN